MKKAVSLIIAATICAVSVLGGCNDFIADTPSESSTATESYALESGEVEFTHSANPVITEEDEPSNCPLSQSQIDSVVQNARSTIEASEFSGTALVSVGNTILFEESYGNTDGIGKNQNTNDTYYQIGSLTKQFTGAAILLLEKEGKVNHNDTLDKYFSGYDYLKDIKISYLLEMTAGFSDYMTTIEGDEKLLDKYVAAAKKSDEEAQKFIVNTILQEGIVTNPGEVYIYSNSSYYLLGMIIEQVTGMSYRDYLQKTFFDPYGMKDTYFVGDGKDNQTGYSFAEEKYVSDKDDKYVKAEGDYPYLFSAGCVVSTAEDINKWLDVVLSEELLAETDYRKIENSISYYNYGWNTSDNCWHHGGRTYAYSSQIFVDRKTDVKVVLLSNISFYENISTIAFQIFQPTNNVTKEALHQ